MFVPSASICCLHRRRPSRADGDEDDHRGDADRDAEQRQQRAQPVREHALHRHPERLEQAHAVTPLLSDRCGRGTAVDGRCRRRDDLAVGELDHALRVRGDVVLVGDHHDRPARAR